MAISRVDGVQRTEPQVKVEKKVEVKVQVKTTVQENGTEKLSASRFQGEQVRLKLQNQFQAKQPTQNYDDQIENLRNIRRNLPPEDQAAIDRSIRGLELTRDSSDPVKVRAMAEELVNNNGGRDNFDHLEAGRDLAEIARLSPAAGKAVLDETLNIVKTEDRDEIAQDFVENMSDTELTNLARTPEGREMLETAKHELEQGNVHDDERATISRIEVALTSANQSKTEGVDAAFERVSEAMDSFGYDGGAEVLASEIERLESLYGSDASAELLTRLYREKPDELGTAIRLSDDLSETQKNNLGRAFGNAFDNFTAEEKNGFGEWVAGNIYADAFTPSALGNSADTFGDILSRGFNNEMKTAAVNGIMELAGTIQPRMFGDNGGVDVQALFTSAAMIADSSYGDSRTAMLETIIKTLPKINLPSLIKDTEVKDALSRLFMHAGEDLLHRAAPDGAYGSQDFQAGMIKFMELTLFSENPNSLRPQTMEYMVRLTQNVGDAAAEPPVSQSEYEAAHGGWSQQDHVEAMSGLMAMAWKAADNQKDAIRASEAQRKQTMQMFTGLAFSFVPGAGKVLGELGGEGAEFLEQIAGKVRDFAWDKAKGALQSGVEGQLADLMSDDSIENIDTMLGNLRDVILSLNASLPNGEDGELDLRSKFQSAFSFYQLIQF